MVWSQCRAVYKGVNISPEKWSHGPSPLSYIITFFKCKVNVEGVSHIHLFEALQLGWKSRLLPGKDGMFHYY